MNRVDRQFEQLGRIRLEPADENFETTAEARWAIECSFPQQQAEQAKAIQSGQEVTVRGRFTRRQVPDGNLVLTGCEVVKIS